MGRNDTEMTLGDNRIRSYRGCPQICKCTATGLNTKHII